jgi:predicted O-methyltransferase YrrM
VVEVLARLHADSDREDPRAARRVSAREAQLGRRLAAAERYELYGDAPLAISRAVGRLYYVLTMARRPQTIVEFGASRGISTIYLAAGLRDGGGGSLISTEILAGKASRAQENLRAAGLADLVEIRVGDALTTLSDEPVDISMLVLDGRNDQYVPVLELLRPRLAPGALVVADLNTDDPDIAAYQAHVRQTGGGFFSIELPLDAGVEVSVPEAQGPSDPGTRGRGRGAATPRR